MSCFFIPRQYYNEITFSIVFIGRDTFPNLLNSCLNEEILQSFGAFDDAAGSRYFSFNDEVREKRITDLDLCLLASIQDPSVKPGDPAQKVLDLFEKRLLADDCNFGADAIQAGN